MKTSGETVKRKMWSSKNKRRELTGKGTGVGGKGVVLLEGKRYPRSQEGEGRGKKN